MKKFLSIFLTVFVCGNKVKKHYQIFKATISVKYWSILGQSWWIWFQMTEKRKVFKSYPSDFCTIFIQMVSEVIWGNFRRFKKIDSTWGNMRILFNKYYTNRILFDKASIFWKTYFHWYGGTVVRVMDS